MRYIQENNKKKGSSKKKENSRKKKPMWLKVLLLIVTVSIFALAMSVITTDKNAHNIVDDKSILNVNPPTVPEDSGEKNDLTGLPISAELKNRRPIAVMINNIEQAQPVLGISRADVIYECLVEGAITRLMALFKDSLPDISMIGSVRSSRPYFINLAKGHDSIYCHVGGSTQALQMLSEGAIDSFDLGIYSNMMWRDVNRRNNLGYEHSAVTSGDRLLNGITASNVSLDYPHKSVNHQDFGDKSQISKGSNCSKITATFSYYKNTIFEYDTSGSSYKVSQFGSAQMDGTYNTQVSKKNILLLYVDTHPIEDSILQEMVLSGSGTGFYASNGKILKINWKKRDSTENFEYYLETGESLTMLPGQTYICCVPLNGNIEYN